MGPVDKKNAYELLVSHLSLRIRDGYIWEVVDKEDSGAYIKNLVKALGVLGRTDAAAELLKALHKRECDGIKKPGNVWNTDIPASSNKDRKEEL